MAARKGAKPAGSSGLRGSHIAIIGVVVLAIAAFGYQLSRGRAGGAALEPVDLGEISDPRQIVQLASGITLGNDDAPVRIVTFIDFQCPSCAQFASQIEPLLREQYVRPGHVQIVYYDFPLTSIHPHAFVAARAARCANEQGRFWEYHDVLLGRQSLWTSAGSVVDLFVDYAAEVGLNRDSFETCLKSDRYADTVTAGMMLGTQLNVPGTPTLFVNDRLAQDWRTWSELRAIIDAELGGA